MPILMTNSRVEFADRLFGFQVLRKSLADSFVAASVFSSELC